MTEYVNPDDNRPEKDNRPVYIDQYYSGYGEPEEAPGPSWLRGVVVGAGVLIAVIIVFILALVILAGMAGFGPARFISVRPSPTATPTPMQLPTLVIPPTPSVMPTLVTTPLPTSAPVDQKTVTPAATPTSQPSPTPPATPTLAPSLSPTLSNQIEVNGYVQVVDTGGVGLSLRAGPGLNNVRLKTAPEGDILQVVGGPMADEQAEIDPQGQVYQWWYLHYADGTEGWARNDFLVPSLPPGE